MKGLTRWVLIAVFLIFCIQAVSAFAVSSIVIDPSGSLVPNTNVIVTYKVDFTASGDETFASGDELQMSTDLDKAKWSYSLVLDGVDTPQPQTSGRVLTVSGWVLSYPSSMEEQLKVTVEGITPTISQTTNKTLVKICEYDSHNNIISCVERTTVIVNIAEVQTKITEMKSALGEYRAHIDEKSALGIDTASGEAKYSEADQKIKAAESRKSTEYAQAYSDLDGAQKAMEDGEIALDRAWADMEVTNAKIPIDNVDGVIAWFKGNASTANDPTLVGTIITKREIAVQSLTTATDEIDSGNYAQARNKAQEAFNKGNESYTDALARKKVLESGFQWPTIPGIPNIGKLLIPIVVVVVIILVIVGVVIYRKRSHWDELG